VLIIVSVHYIYRKLIMRFLILFAVSVFFASIVKAQTAILYNYEGTFDDATFSVEGAILGKGLVIDHISHTGDMLSELQTMLVQI